MLKKVMGNDKLLVFLLMLPGILHFIIFKYVPLAGNMIAFQDYSMFKGIWNSPWVGFKHFVTIFTYEEFFQVVRNTMLFSLMSIVFGFPAPLILALLLNELTKMWFKRSIQTLLYLPHFLSWVIVGGIFINLLSTEGVMNSLLSLLGMEPIDFLTSTEYFRGMIISIGIWKGIGWGTIIYLAALAGVNPNLYEAAVVDGAGRWKQMWHVTLPALMPTIVVLFLLQIGSVLESNVEQILIFLNPLVRDVGEVVDTYVYRVGLLNAQFSYTTAIGLFQSIVGLVLVISLNALAKKTSGESIY
ncbi:putative aldouronate transport system permease protein [Paenibacillus sp. UNCCL117]|uniref:ABC transporter permease n=1 Tax=unclassified Paenibacillus TaxID=185978 RepID=UPI00088EA2C3|nr:MULTISPECIES: ABC transporter permease subunit [unclassified Paenibacillus]SDC95014.1 putative aldouronate transport system permease protein [Paenibacillus sp. cl123]SFW29927.1 putative aldouronate transport system permease protein [Paenibacillus sp. UNCCL117]